MNEEEIDDIIERYVLNTMAPDERIAFESELKVHPEWKEKIRFHDLLLSLLNSESKSFKNAVHSAKLIQSKNAKYNYPKIIAVFLSLLLLTLIFNKSFYSNRQPTLNDKIKSNSPLDDSILKSSDSIDRFDNAAKASQMKSKMYELFAFKNIFFSLLIYIKTRMIYNEQIQFGDRLFKAYMTAEYTFFLHRNSAELLRNVHNETRLIISGVLMPLMQIILDGLVLLMIVCLLLSQAHLHKRKTRGRSLVCA